MTSASPHRCRSPAGRDHWGQSAHTLAPLCGIAVRPGRMRLPGSAACSPDEQNGERVTSEPNSDLEALTLSLLNDLASAVTSREHSRVFEELTGVSLPTSELRLLEFLNGREPVAASAIAAALTTDPSLTSRQTRRLEQAGYLGRLSDPADGRRTLLHLTTEAQSVMNTSLLHFADPYLDIVGEWSEREVVDLERWLHQVHDGLAKWLPDRPESEAGRVWRRLVSEDASLPPALSAARQELGETVILLFTWIGQARWFEQLLQRQAVPLSHQAYVTLRTVQRHGPLPVSDLADLTWVDHTQASKRISRLVKLNFVERAVDSFDRRSSLVRCTRQGSALLRRLANTQLLDLRDAVGPVAESDHGRWTELMARYFVALRERGLLFESSAS